jgi:Tetratricopeptide repeat
MAPTTMTPIRAFILAVLLPVTSTSAQPVKHIGLSFEDKLVACATSVFGKRALIRSDIAISKDVPCAGSRDALVSELKDRGIAIVEAKSYTVLLPANAMPGSGGYGAYVSDDFDIYVRVEADPNWIKGSQQLSVSEQNEISDKIMQEGRWPPIFPLDVADDGIHWLPAGAPVPVEILLQLNAYELKPGVESVIGVFGQRWGDVERLSYGEMRGGKYKLLWDSPLVGGRGFGLGYEDVNGDGRREIIVTWGEGRFETPALAIFTSNGDELTRQLCRAEDRNGDFPTAEGYVCAIRGERINLVDPKEGKRDILVVPYNCKDSGYTDRYSLVGGRYELPIPILSSVTPNVATEGDDPPRLILEGKGFSCGSVIKFTPSDHDAASAPSDGEDYFSVWPKFVSPTRLRAEGLDSDMFGRPGKWSMVVEDSSSASNALGLTVAAKSARAVHVEKIQGAISANAQGLQLMRQGDYGPAVVDFNEAFQLDPGNAEYADNAGFACYKLRDYENSVAWLTQATRLDPKRAVAHLNLGDALAKLNRSAEAREAYNKYLELAPNSKAAPDVKRKLDALPPSP